MTMRRHFINVTVFLSMFVVVFISAQVFITKSSADHYLASSPNRTCQSDGEYYHVHWERTSSSVDVYYKLEIIDENGATGEYQGTVDDAVDDWNAGQTYVDLIQDNFSDWDVLARVHQFGTEYLGKVTLDPNQCTYPNNNTSTHACANRPCPRQGRW